ncbi:uncharacterized protein LOC119838918 [Zerene cesonia]|uniref:uncharacterized protein LOC119838918 n=1 Tax=Zerene cesonia TaxID=33412 RepID=UPI0018E4DDFE|nr:uncharacterized protein LOC119838918 [Zerene cesonia]
MTTENAMEPWLLEITEGIDAILKKIDDIIEKDQKQMKECKKRFEQEHRLAQESKLNEELTQQLAELSKRTSEMDRVCETFKSRLTIADSDKNRLEMAKEAYQIGKELTGIRFDFTAPPNIAKGYIKNSSRRLLQPFELEADSEALWDQVRTAFPNPLENMMEK